MTTDERAGLSVRSYFSASTRLKSTNFSVHVAYGCISVLLWYVAICYVTYGLPVLPVDDVMFSRNRSGKGEFSLTDSAIKLSQFGINNPIAPYIRSYTTLLFIVNGLFC